MHLKEFTRKNKPTLMKVTNGFARRKLVGIDVLPADLPMDLQGLRVALYRGLTDRRSLAELSTIVLVALSHRKQYHQVCVSNLRSAALRIQFSCEVHFKMAVIVLFGGCEMGLFLKLRSKSSF